MPQFPLFSIKKFQSSSKSGTEAVRDGLGPVGTGLRVYGGLTLCPPAGGRAKCQSGKGRPHLATGVKVSPGGQGKVECKRMGKIAFYRQTFFFLSFFFCFRCHYSDRATRRRPASLRLRLVGPVAPVPPHPPVLPASCMTASESTGGGRTFRCYAEFSACFLALPSSKSARAPLSSGV